MKTKLLKLAIYVTFSIAATGCTDSLRTSSTWQVHDANRPQPWIVTPAQQPGHPPIDAIILFDGKNLSHWTSDKTGGPAKWKVENGYMEVTKKAGDISTKESFGDCQLHIEWASPENIYDDKQDRGNSGVFFMGRYEVQILDSYYNKTYPDGQAAAVYGQSPPLVNASLPPGQWQTYDIIFHSPKFKKDKLIKPATVTVLHNGILVQDHWQIKGSTREDPTIYEAHPEKLPIQLQDHSTPVRYRNIWIREL